MSLVSDNKNNNTENKARLQQLKINNLAIILGTKNKSVSLIIREVAKNTITL